MPETEKKLSDVKQAMYDAQTELRHLGAGAPSTLNREHLVQVGEGAQKTGGLAAVVPAVIGDISGCVRNPTEAMLFALGMLFAQKILAQAGKEDDAAAHHEPTPAPVEEF